MEISKKQSLSETFSLYFEVTPGHYVSGQRVRWRLEDGLRRRDDEGWVMDSVLWDKIDPTRGHNVFFLKASDLYISLPTIGR